MAEWRQQIMRSLCIFCLSVLILASAGCGIQPTVLQDKPSSTPYPRPDVPPPASDFGLPNTATRLKPILTAYYKAIDSRNETALRKIVSKHFIESYENAIKGTKTSLVQYLAIAEDVKHPLEVRNELFYRGDAGVQVLSPNGWEWKGLTLENDAWKVTDNAQLPLVNVPD